MLNSFYYSTFALLATLCCLSQYGLRGTEAAAVMSVDLGSEWMKVGVVSPGVPMEIVLNRESKRKTPAILAFRDGVRTFGEDGVTVGIRDPAAAYGYLLDLLGKKIDNPIVDLYRQRFPYYNIVTDPERHTLIFKKSEEEQFTVEELVAQMLMKAKEYTQESTGQPITECVLTVPGYFGQAEREALLAAARLANLNVLQLINDYSAVALHHGVFNRADINETAQYIVFYDMGASSTTASVVSYQLIKDKQTKETVPRVQVLGVGFDRTLGGLEIQLRLRDHLAKEFNALKKTKTDVTTSARALAKLFKEAGRVKNVLSANMDHYAQIENLLEDQDFKTQVTREQLEEMCADLWPRLTRPLERALQTAHLSLESISQVILFGGGTRVPKVQEIIRQAIKQEPGKGLNADEAAAIGAVYKAADLATGFKVKKFSLKDAVVYPIHINFKRATDAEAKKGEEHSVKRVLFPHMNAYPQKKVITFNKHTQDFEFYVHYGELESYYTEDEIKYIGSRNISKVMLQKVEELLQQKKDEVLDSKGIKAYFALDDSGIFHCTGVEYVYEKQQIVEPEDDESTLSKLGSTISKLFSQDQDKEKDTKEEKSDNEENKEKPADNESNETKQTDAQPNKTEEGAEQTEQPKNDTVKLVTVKLPVEHELVLSFAQPLTGEAFKQSVEKLNAINKEEEQRNRLQSSFNALESHVVETQQKLGEKEYASCLTEAEKEKILEECSKISDWLYEHEEPATAELYENRLQALKELTNIFMARHWEHEERPEALKALDGMLDGAKKFLENAKNLTKETNTEKDVFTQVEVDALSKVIDDTQDWQKVEVAAQKKLKRNEDVRLLVKTITGKMAALDREVKYLVNKIKIWKPKPTKKEKSASKKKDKKTKDEEGKEGEAEEERAEEEIKAEDEVKPEEQVRPEEAEENGSFENESAEEVGTIGTGEEAKEEEKESTTDKAGKKSKNTTNTPRSDL